MNGLGLMYSTHNILEHVQYPPPIDPLLNTWDALCSTIGIQVACIDAHRGVGVGIKTKDTRIGLANESALVLRIQET